MILKGDIRKLTAIHNPDSFSGRVREGILQQKSEDMKQSEGSKMPDISEIRVLKVISHC